MTRMSSLSNHPAVSFWLALFPSLGGHFHLGSRLFRLALLAGWPDGAPAKVSGYG
jgi:hypothetical protein